MQSDTHDLALHRQTLKRFTEPELLGFFTHYDVLEIFAFSTSDNKAYNAFTLLVAEEHARPPDPTSIYLGDRIRIGGLKGWWFGIRQSKLAIEALDDRLSSFDQTKHWCISGDPLRVGTLIPIPPLFVAPDATNSASWNGILKNNFWSGSYVIELMDTAKTNMAFLLDDPKRLQELSAAVQQQVPIKLASMSDRLGNIVVQLPVTVLNATFANCRETGEALIDIAWHPKSAPRPLRATCEMQFDNILASYASSSVSENQSALATTDSPGMQRAVLWDDDKKLLLAATMPTAFITTVGFVMQIMDPEPRVFTIRGQNAADRQARVGLVNAQDSRVTAPSIDKGERWTHQRIFREETERLIAQRRFIQYKPAPGQQDTMHDQALEDIRALIRLHGRLGAWLWDPYLSTDDLLQTLFHCPFKGAELRALTAGKRTAHAGLPFREEQQAALKQAQSNLRGLRLEYRMRHGQKGWNFHDRFLIFPKTDHGPLAWSLGASVNGAGRQHHILQRVDDAQLIADAFQELWDELDHPDNLVWKVP